EETLTALSKRARDVESDPCEIKSTFTEVEGGVKLDIDFVFACEAETLIFQLGLR
ncbi:YfcZ/YiiS family protein, partial [Enterobacter hormaechei]